MRPGKIVRNDPKPHYQRDWQCPRRHQYSPSVKVGIVVWCFIASPCRRFIPGFCDLAVTVCVKNCWTPALGVAFIPSLIVDLRIKPTDHLPVTAEVRYRSRPQRIEDDGFQSRCQSGRIFLLPDQNNLFPGPRGPGGKFFSSICFGPFLTPVRVIGMTNSSGQPHTSGRVQHGIVRVGRVVPKGPSSPKSRHGLKLSVANIEELQNGPGGSGILIMVEWCSAVSVTKR
ncbi:MAG: hypothetical protein Ct9H300mP25_17370 [Acidobacteriota bacterium]|nr:MAG: hypothetical protein Ct9H300mP25_17370 [Acidobacteriota bacterium]